MASLAQLTSELAAGRRPDRDAAALAAGLLSQPELADDDKVAYLSALADLGEDAEIVAAFAETYRDKARTLDLGDLPARAIDIVGTGGDRSGSFNISSASALVVAAAGVPVIKHGNRSITSQSGSADFLAGLGVDLEADDARLLRALRQANFCFLFAPAFHPAFRAIGPARKRLAELGRKSIFNILGPLINPARPAHMMVGVFAERWVAPLAGALQSLEVRRGLVVHGKVGEGMDELTSAGPARVRGVGGLSSVDGEWLPGDFGLSTCPSSDLLGGSPAHNLGLLSDLLVGAAPDGLLDTVCLSAGAALWVAGEAADPGAGSLRAREVILGGALRENLRVLREAYRV